MVPVLLVQLLSSWVVQMAPWGRRQAMAIACHATPHQLLESHKMRECAVLFFEEIRDYLLQARQERRLSAAGPKKWNFNKTGTRK